MPTIKLLLPLRSRNDESAMGLGKEFMPRYCQGGFMYQIKCSKSYLKSVIVSELHNLST